MNKFKKIICLFFVMLMFFSVSISANSVYKTTSNSPFEITVSTDKSNYKATDVATITVKVKNTSGKEIKNVSAEAVFGNLTAVKRKASETSKSVDVLKPNKSISFTYKAIVNKDQVKLNFFQKIILFFVRLFNGAYNPSSISGNGRMVIEQKDTIKFDGKNVVNTVKVWYEKNGSSKPSDNLTYEELVKDVDIDEIYDYDESDISVDEETGIKYINNVIIIDFDLNCTEERKAEIINSINGKVVGGIEGLNLLQVEVKNLSYNELECLCDRLNKNNDIYAEFEEVYSLSSSSMPNDPWNENEQYIEYVDWFNTSISNHNWWANAIELRQAWGYEKYFSNINIGIADIGFVNSHEDLNINIVSEENTSSNHGTHVAGIIGATHDNNKGIAGVIKNCNMYGYDLTNSNGEFNNSIFKIADYKALDTLVEKYKCKIINFSVGQNVYINENIYYTDEDFTNEITNKKIDSWGYSASRKVGKLLEKGYDFIVIQSTGNRAENTDLGIDKKYQGTFCSISSENCYSNNKISANEIIKRVITVSAATIYDKNKSYELTDFSNGSANISAPGASIYSTVAGIEDKKNNLTSGQKYGLMSGTSMAAPIVSGVAGLVWSVNPKFNGAKVWDIVCKNVDYNIMVYDNPNSTDISGNSRLVNAKLAVEEAIRQTYATGYITGKVTDISSSTRKAVPNVNIKATEKNTNKTIYAKTNADGTFSLTLPAGTYNLDFSKGWAGVLIEDEIVTTDCYKDLGNIEMMIPVSQGSGTVKDKRTKKPIANVKVEVSDNYYSLDDKFVFETTTDENGQFNFEVSSSDDCKLGFYKDNYNDFELKFDCSGHVDLGDVLLTPTGSDDDDNNDDNHTDDDVVASGECGADGSNVIWKLYNDGELVISGQGEMKNYSSSNVPWMDYRNSIQTLKFNNGITRIGDYAFYRCENLKYISFSNSVTHIGWYAFNSCSSITNLEIPDNIINIGFYAFSWCMNLTRVTISDKVKGIGLGSFLFCDKLESINVSSDNKFYSTSEGVLFNKDKTKLLQYPGGKIQASYVIPDSVTSLADYSFRGCDNLSNLNFGKNIKTVGDFVFSGCESLININMNSKLEKLGVGNFEGCGKLENINVSEYNNTFSSIDGVLFNNDRSTLIRYPSGKAQTSYTIPDSTKIISYQAFDACKFSNIYLGDGILEIGDEAFQSCVNLENVVIPKTAKEIGNRIFYGCVRIKKITILSMDCLLSGEATFAIYNNASKLVYPTIYGFSNSTTETHAKKYNLKFVKID